MTRPSSVWYIATALVSAFAALLLLTAAGALFGGGTSSTASDAQEASLQPEPQDASEPDDQTTGQPSSSPDLVASEDAPVAVHSLVASSTAPVEPQPELAPSTASDIPVTNQTTSASAGTTPAADAVQTKSQGSNSQTVATGSAGSGSKAASTNAAQTSGAPGISMTKSISCDASGQHCNFALTTVSSDGKTTVTNTYGPNGVSTSSCSSASVSGAASKPSVSSDLKINPDGSFSYKLASSSGAAPSPCP